MSDDVGQFLDRAGGFLRSRPDLHTMALTATAKLLTQGSGGTAANLFGWLGEGKDVGAVFYCLSSRRLNVSSVSPERADQLAVRLIGLGYELSGVTSDEDTATAFVDAWRCRAGAEATPGWRGRLYRLGTLVPPARRPEGRLRVVDARDREHVLRWCNEFLAAIGGTGSVDVGSWHNSVFAGKNYSLWETSDGTPVSMTGSTPLIDGMVRIDLVYTPEEFRGHGYAGAMTAEVSAAALDAGATHVVLFTDPANATSNALYRRIGYVPISEMIGYDFR